MPAPIDEFIPDQAYCALEEKITFALLANFPQFAFIVFVIIVAIIFYAIEKKKHRIRAIIFTALILIGIAVYLKYYVFSGNLYYSFEYGKLWWPTNSLYCLN